MAENATKEAVENAEGDQVLYYLLSVMMMLLGMVLMKILPTCRSRWNPGNDEDSIRVRSMRSISSPMALDGETTWSLSRPRALAEHPTSTFRIELMNIM